MWYKIFGKFFEMAMCFWEFKKFSETILENFSDFQDVLHTLGIFLKN